MRHVFIINPNAGKKGSTQTLEEQIRREFSGREYEVYMTEGPGHAQALARAAAQVGDEVRIYACGGDGSLNEAVNGAAGYDNAAVTNVPKGTGNDFLKIFGKENRGRFGDLRDLSEGPQAAMDLIDCNGRLGIGVVCAGVDARIADDVDKYKALPLIHGPGAYILSLIENVLFKGITRPTAVEVEDIRYEGETSIICVCNGRYYGGGFMPVGDNMPDDGVLETLVVPQVTRRTFFRLVGDYAKGLYSKHPDVVWARRGRGLTFRTLDQRELVAVVDGEVMRDRAFTVTLSDKKVNFFYPAGLTYGQVSSGTPAAAL